MLRQLKEEKDIQQVERVRAQQFAIIRRLFVGTFVLTTKITEVLQMSLAVTTIIILFCG